MRVDGDVLQAAVHALIVAATYLAAAGGGASAASMTQSPNTAILSGNRKHSPQQNRYCATLEQQKNVNLEALAGYWYAVETIGHRDEDRSGEAYKEISLCPLMFLSQLDNSTDLRLLWEEPLGKIEYRFRVVDPHDRGFWMSLGQQNGSLTDNEQYPYRQFAGTVQVMRAVSTDMVLTFCSPQTHHYSMIMSRNKTMSDETLHSLNQMLSDRGLLLANTRVACRGGAASTATLGAGAVLGLAVAVVLLVRRDRDLIAC